MDELVNKKKKRRRTKRGQKLHTAIIKKNKTVDKRMMQ